MNSYSAPAPGQPPLDERPAELLQNLIRFDTTNPTGNEAACLGYINSILSQDGLETMILASDEARPNLVTRLKGQGLAAPHGLFLRQLLNPALTNRILDRLGPMGETLDALLHNTVSPTIVHASNTINVIPSQVSVELDGRLLPGFSPDDILTELCPVVGDEVELEILGYEAGPPEPDMGLFDTLAGILHEADPGGTPGPLLMAGVTDARHFSRLGIQTYGFTPMTMPPGFDFRKLAHGADQRIPILALDFGIEALYRLLQRFGEAS